VVQPWTLDVIPIFVEEIETNSPGTPFFLVGVHTELRPGAKQSISTEQGIEKAAHVGALHYYEVSAVRLEGLQACFTGSVEVWKKQIITNGDK